jgi:hypothetical protein
MESVRTSALATRFRPRCLATYSAWSAVRMTLDRSISPRQPARPMLIVTKVETSSPQTSLAAQARRRSSVYRAAWSSVTPAISIANSSRPWRAAAAKHAYPDGSGEIHVTGEQRGGVLHVEVSDQGIGLPKDFDIDQPRASLGFKVIKSLLGQLDGRITVSSHQPKGAAIQLDLPLDLQS